MITARKWIAVGFGGPEVLRNAAGPPGTRWSPAASSSADNGTPRPPLVSHR